MDEDRPLHFPRPPWSWYQPFALLAAVIVGMFAGMFAAIILYQDYEPPARPRYEAKITMTRPARAPVRHLLGPDPAEVIAYRTACGLLMEAGRVRDLPGECDCRRCRGTDYHAWLEDSEARWRLASQPAEASDGN